MGHIHLTILCVILDHVSRCHRLRVEFVTYIIEAQCLTKAFISTKGYYYEAEIMGHRIVWTVPHNCVTEVISLISAIVKQDYTFGKFILVVWVGLVVVTLYQLYNYGYYSFVFCILCKCGDIACLKIAFRFHEYYSS